MCSLVFNQQQAHGSEARGLFLHIQSEVTKGEFLHEWSKSTCEWFNLNSKVASQVAAQELGLEPYAIEVVCASKALGTSEKLMDDAQKSGRYRYYFELTQLASGDLQLTVSNWLKPGQPGFEDTDFSKIGWTLRRSSDFNGDPLSIGTDKQKLTLAHVLKKFLENDYLRRWNQEALLLAGLSESETLDVKDGKIIDKSTGKELNLQEAYQKFKDENPRNKNYLRAGLELTAVLGISAANYWTVGRTHNMIDWDFNKVFGKAQLERFSGFKGFKFDDNAFGTNKDHALAGTGYYYLARSNNLSSLESFLAAFAASGIWETSIEYREVISLNDMIFTPVGGSVIGETAYQMGEFFRTSKDTTFNKIFGSVFGVGPTLHDYMDGTKPNRAKEFDELGFNAEKFHEFSLSISSGVRGTHPPHSGRSSSSVSEIAFDSKIINIPEYGHEGGVSKVILDTVLTETALRASLGPGGVDDLSALLKAAFAGYYQQDLRKDPQGRLQGYSLILAGSSAFEYDSNSTLKNHDEIAVVHFLGTTGELAIYRPDYVVKIGLDIFGDFALVDSFALESYQQANPQEYLRSVLQHHQYYYAMGITVAPKVEVAYGAWRAGASLRYETFNSIDQGNRHGEDKLNLEDSFNRIELWINREILPRLRVGVRTGIYKRTGQITGAGSSQESGSEYRIMGQAMYLF